MFFARFTPKARSDTLASLRCDLFQIGAAKGICDDVLSLRQKAQFEALSDARRIARRPTGR